MNRVTLSLSVFLVVAVSSSARADFNESLCERERGSHVDVLTSTYSQACYGHIDRDDRGIYVRTVMLPEPMSGDVRGSRDLKSIVYVASYLPLMADEAMKTNPVVVRVYREGALKKEYRLLELATKADLRESTSHVRFTASVGSIGANDQLTLITITGAKLVFDTVTGARSR
jgi:hypothetical protein